MRKPACCFLILTFLVGCNRSPGKDETFKWMQQTLAHHNGIREQFAGAVPDNITILAQFNYHDCHVEYLTTKGDDTVNVDMTEIDPNSLTIKKIGDSTWVLFKGRNSQRVVRYVEASGQFAYDSEEGGFSLDSQEYATSFLNAFKHAVILCGGKPSTF